MKVSEHQEDGEIISVSNQANSIEKSDLENVKIKIATSDILLAKRQITINNKIEEKKKQAEIETQELSEQLQAGKNLTPAGLQLTRLGINITEAIKYADKDAIDLATRIRHKVDLYEKERCENDWMYLMLFPPEKNDQEYVQTRYKYIMIIVEAVIDEFVSNCNAKGEPFLGENVLYMIRKIALPSIISVEQWKEKLDNIRLFKNFKAQDEKPVSPQINKDVLINKLRNSTDKRKNAAVSFYEQAYTNDTKIPDNKQIPNKYKRLKGPDIQAAFEYLLIDGINSKKYIPKPSPAKKDAEDALLMAFLLWSPGIFNYHCNTTEKGLKIAFPARALEFMYGGQKQPGLQQSYDAYITGCAIPNSHSIMNIYLLTKTIRTYPMYVGFYNSAERNREMDDYERRNAKKRKGEAAIVYT